jgi:stage V sporulation protein AA
MCVKQPETIYVRLRYRFYTQVDETITIGKIAQVIGPNQLKDQICRLPQYTITKEDSSYVVIDAMDVIETIHTHFPHVDIQTVGPTQTVLEVRLKKRKVGPLFITLVWLLLFIGAALTIMNFHEDVAMGDVHQKIYQLITGEKKEKPLIIQIPYSLGVGIGMVLFFNHLFKKKFNEEPSPLEVEMFKYQQDLDQYIVIQEKRKRETKPDVD